jgi:hypothetical protein
MNDSKRQRIVIETDPLPDEVLQELRRLEREGLCSLTIEPMSDDEIDDDDIKAMEDYHEWRRSRSVK